MTGSVEKTCPQIDKYGCVRYYNEDGKLHRRDGPAVEYICGNNLYFINGYLTGMDGPLFEHGPGFEQWNRSVGIALARANGEIQKFAPHEEEKEVKQVLLFLPDDIVIDTLNSLKGLEGAFDCSNDCSWQVAFKLQNGKILRFGWTDEDVSEHKNCLWIDIYEGLAIKGGDPRIK